MTEPTENQPTVAAPKKAVRRKTTRAKTTKAAVPAVSEENAAIAPAPAPELPLATETPIEETSTAPAHVGATANEPAQTPSEPVVPASAPPVDRRDTAIEQRAPAKSTGDALESLRAAVAFVRPPAAPRTDSSESGLDSLRAAARAERTVPSRPAEVREPREPELVGEPVFGEGIVEVSGKGFGFIRDQKRNFSQNPADVFVTPETVRRFNLRDGQWIKGEIRRGNRGPQLFRLSEINGAEPDSVANLPLFEELTVISPQERIRLETVPERFTTRIMDMMTPIGKGQRGLIVAPPRTGKTTLLQHIADAVAKNHPETKLIILLVDERPEEVTEIRRSCPTAEIMASSNDSDLKSHTRIAQLAIERAKRLVEQGQDAFVLLDSITRVGRAFNNSMGGGGRTMSGGIDARALEIPRKLFASARNTEEAGSLTIIATALIDTGSRMDELIFQEFKGTGNMELVLDRKISDLRVYPAVDIFKSGTRKEELLLPADQLAKINVIRRGLSGHKPEEAIERLLMFVKKFPTNAQMLKEIPG
ncbi:MAG: transcription termination factor Rho [Chthoniobacter sp.]|jgi:transcription termination factor Rho|nr:transcription termination factor Rho [Chthoniobacter sp.]